MLRGGPLGRGRCAARAVAWPGRSYQTEMLVELRRNWDGTLARAVRKTVKEVPLAQLKNDFSRYLKEAAVRQIVITRHGKPAGVLIGFESEDDWLEYRSA